MTSDGEADELPMNPATSEASEVGEAFGTSKALGTSKASGIGIAHRASESGESDEVPEGFNLPLALVDALPVLFFIASAILLATRVAHPLFVVGAVLAALGGLGKVLWKFIMAVAHKNVAWLGRQMRYVMPAGFVLMLIGVLLSNVSWSGVMAAMLSWPVWLFLLAWVACMVAMGWFATHNEQMDAHSNWTEQIVNAIGQGCLLVAVILA